MKKSSLLVDTDILIHYLNHRQYRQYLESEEWKVHYSAVTKKELLIKQGLSDQERRIILRLLNSYRQVHITQTIARRYVELRQRYPMLERNDALIAASAVVRRMPLLSGNQRHFRIVAGLDLLPLLAHDIESKNPIF